MRARTRTDSDGRRQCAKRLGSAGPAADHPEADHTRADRRCVRERACACVCVLCVRVRACVLVRARRADHPREAGSGLVARGSGAAGRRRPAAGLMARAVRAAPAECAASTMDLEWESWKCTAP